MVALRFKNELILRRDLPVHPSFSCRSLLGTCVHSQPADEPGAHGSSPVRN